jgi:flagellar basal-body rod protein FlgG
MQALHTAATGMFAQEMNVEVISNNVANMRTTGFKRQYIQFQDLLYEQIVRPGTTSSDQNTAIPSGVYIGSGVKTVATPRITTQGSLSPTKNPYDLAVNGEGYFRVTMPDGTLAYTRDGSFNLDGNGRLVNQSGYLVDPAITVPQNATSFAVSAQGLVTATLPGQTAPQQLGQLTLSRFVNKAGLQSVGDNFFLPTEASGQPIDAVPASEGFGTLQQGYVEESNVNSVTEITSLVAAQRAYELNAKVISAADQMLSSANNLFRS